jgi:hypothetical protein
MRKILLKLHLRILNGLGIGLLLALSLNTKAQVYLAEGFSSASGTTPPLGWTNTSGPAATLPASLWSAGNPGARTITGANFLGNFFILDSDFLGQNNTQDATLTTPSINLSTSANPLIKFSEQFRFSSPQNGVLQYSIDGGATWTTLLTRTSSYGYANPALETTIPVPGAAFQPNVQFRWNIVTTWGYWWAIDSVIVKETVIPAPATLLTFSALGKKATTLNWIDNSVDETSFKIYRSTDSINFTLVTTLTSTTEATTGNPYSYVQTGLNPGTLYYYRITASADGESAPLSGSQPTVPAGIVSTTSIGGNWTDPTTWAGGIVPIVEDTADILAGALVTIDANSTIASISISGSLDYSSAATTFSSKGNVTINAGGTFNVFNGTTGKTLNIAGNISNNGTIDLSQTGALLNLNGSTAQTIGGFGALTLNTISSLTFNNSATLPIINWNLTNTIISGTLTFTKGLVALGSSNAMTLGTSSSSLGTLSYSSGGFTSGTFTRWWATGIAGQTISAGAIPTAGVGTYPFAGLTAGTPTIVYSRNAYIRQTVASTTGGTISVKHNAVSGLSAAAFTDGAYSINNLSNSNWEVSTLGITGTPTYSVSLSAQGTYLAKTANGRITFAAASMGGTHQAGTTLPNVQRVSVPLTDLTNSWYVGINSSDVLFSTIASGNWEDPLIWNKGLAPTCNDTILIAQGHNVTVNAIAASAKAVTIIDGGTLTVSGSTLTVGCTLNNASLTVNGKLAVTGGTLRINGNLFNNQSGRLHQSGGSIIVDGNDSGKVATSASGHLVDMYATTDTSVVFTGGTFTIIDPAVSSTAVSFKVYPNQPVNFSTAHTLILGDGISTEPGGTNGFDINLFNTGTGVAILGNLVINAPYGTNRYVRTENNIGILGNLTITQGAYRMSSTHYIKGNIINNDTLINTSTLNLANYTNAIVSANPTAQTISGSGKYLNSTTTSTASMNSLTLNNSNAAGVTLPKFSISGTLTLTRGVFNTTAIDTLRLGTSTAAGTLVGGHDSAYINGPFYRTFAASRTAVATYNQSTLFPVGKGGRYLGLMLDPTTNAGGSIILKAEAFNANSGTIGAGTTTLSNIRWEALVTNGASNFVSSHILLADSASAFDSTSKVLSAPSAAGAYTGITQPITYASSPRKIIYTLSQQIPVVDFTGYFAYGQLTPCATPVDQPTAFVATDLGATSFNASFTAALSNPSHYLVVRYPNGSLTTAPVNNTIYAVNTPLGLGTVVANTTGTAFNQSGLTAGTTYDYVVYAYNNSACFGPVYNTTSPLFNTIITCAAAVTVPAVGSPIFKSDTGFIASWNPIGVVGATYKIDVSTNSGFTSYVSGYQSLSTSTDTFAVISGLAPSTQYYYRVKAIDGTCTSLPSPNQGIKTLCTPVTNFPFLESFSATLDSCSNSVSVGGNLTYRWIPTTADATHGAAGPQAGSHFLYLYVFLANTAGNTYEYTMPYLDLGTTPKSLSYQYFLGSGGYTTSPVPLTVYVSSNGGNTWDSLYAHTTANSTFAGNSSITNWHPNSVDLSAYSGRVLVKFVSYSNYGGGTCDQGLDEISINEILPATVLSTEATNITQNMATIGGTILSNGNAALSTTGVVFGTSANPSIGGLGVIDSVSVTPAQSGTFSFNLESLTGLTTYHYRAYAINSAGTSYGGDSTFTTLSTPIVPSVIAGGATNIGTSSATLSGDIVSNGGSPVFTSGIVYSTSPNPIISGPGVVDSATTPAVSMGAFSINPTGLTHSTKYYYRSYAINAIGTAYSNQDSFTTAIIISTFPYTQDFEGGAASWSTIAINGSNNWVLGTPSKTIISAAHSGNNTWVTKLTGNYDNSINNAVVSPRIDLTTVTNPVVRFYHKFAVEANYDALVVEVSLDGGNSWSRLDSTLGTGTNYNTPNSYAWYGTASTNGATTGFIQPPKFTSATSYTAPNHYQSNNSDWIQSATPITGGAGQSNVKIRFRFGSDGSDNFGDGWAIDDIEIVDITTPTIPASAVAFSNVLATTANVDWTNGNGNGRLVVARLASDIPVAPVNNTLYNANPFFGTGDSTGLGNFIIYSSSSNSVVSTGLANFTTYSYDVYEYNGKYMHINFAATAATNSATTLPVTFTSFTASPRSNDVLLSWSTASELNNKGFEVERSVNGRDFKTVDFVKGAGNSSRNVNYNLTDAKAFNATNVLYYRLKQIDFDGKFAYSTIVRVSKNAGEANALAVFPNPYSTDYSLSFTATNNGNASIEMVDLQGRVVASQEATISSGPNTLSMKETTNLKSGIYFVRLTINGETQIIKLAKN